MNRDPIGESGGLNLYVFVSNTPVTSIDPYGLDNWANPGAGQNAPPDIVITDPGFRVEPPGDLGFPLAPWDGWLGGPNTIEINQTSWFNNRYPGWVAAMKKHFSKGIEEDILRNCKLLPKHAFPSREYFDESHVLVTPYYGQFKYLFGIYPIRVYDPEETETRYGDKPQGRSSAGGTGIGQFIFGMDNLADVSWEFGAGIRKGCCKKFKWKATLIVSDGLGFNKGDLGDFAQGLYPPRPIIRGRWEISGEGECCE